MVVLAAVVMQSYLADATHCTRIFLTQLAAALSGSRDDEVVLCSPGDHRHPAAAGSWSAAGDVWRTWLLSWVF